MSEKDEANIFEISVSYTQYSTVRVRAGSAAEAIAHLQEDSSWTEDVNWNDGDPHWEYSHSETHDDGDSFDIDLASQDDEASEGTLCFHTGPLVSSGIDGGGLLVVTDAAGQRHEFTLKEKKSVAAGACTWELLVDGVLKDSGHYEVYPNEYNPLVIK